MKVFLSWSGDVSYAVASALHKWLPYFIQSLKPFISSTDISKGARWSEALAKELEDADYGIVCVTPYNLSKPWMNFEAGALSKRFDRAHLTPFLYHLDRSEITGPLAQFQSTVFNREDFWNLLCGLNSILGDSQLDHELLRDTFKIWWPQLEQALENLPAMLLRETRTCYSWLYTTEDLVGRVWAATKWIWIISPNAQLFTGTFKETIIQNLQKGIAYRCFLPARTGIDEDDKADLEDLLNIAISNRSADQSIGKLEYSFIPHTEFEISATTDYVIINPDDDPQAGYHRTMFLRLPYKPSGRSDLVGYWIEVDEASTSHFKTRFAKLWDPSRAIVAGP